MKRPIDDILKYRTMLEKNMPTAGKLSPETATKQDLEQIIANIPKLAISEDWGKEAYIDGGDRDILEKFIKDNLRGSSPIQKIQSFVNGIESNFQKQGSSIEEIFYTLVSHETISKIIYGFSPSGAGFIFEAFLAGLTGGKQINVKSTVTGQPVTDDDIKKENIFEGIMSGKYEMESIFFSDSSKKILTESQLNEKKETDIADFEANNQYFSLKLLTPDKTTNYMAIRGSIPLLKKAMKEQRTITYIIISRVTEKNKSLSLVFYKFDITPKNYRQFIDKSSSSRFTKKMSGKQDAQTAVEKFLDKSGQESSRQSFARLSLDRNRIIEYVRKNVDIIHSVLEPLYVNLNGFSNNLIIYFSSKNIKDRNNAAAVGKDNATNLNKSAGKVLKAVDTTKKI